MESIVAFIITALALGFVGLPLFRERKQDEVPVGDAEYMDSMAGRLLSQKDTALTALRELEFDHAVGSLSDGDYNELRDKYEKRAISLMKTLDEVSEADANGRGRGVSRRTVKKAQPRRGERRQPLELVCAECGEPYGEEDRFCRICGADVSEDSEQALQCPGCGEPYEEGDTFCGACGNRLSVAADGSGPVEDKTPGGRVSRGSGEAAQPQQYGTSPRRRGRHNRQGRPGGNGRDGR